MAEAWELTTRHEQRVEQIRIQADLRRQERISSAEYTAEIERLRGENERELALLHHDLEKENRVLDLKFQELQNSQQVRLEAIQTAIKQQDDFFRHFWELDKEVTQLEARLIEMAAAARIAVEQSTLERAHKDRDQTHELRMEAERRKTITHETDQDIRKERAIRELDREFQGKSAEDVAAILKRLDTP
jgi:Zn-dependent metalloprotease